MELLRPNILTFSSFDANSDSIPSFNLWYSWSDKRTQMIKCYFWTHTCLISAEFFACDGMFSDRHGSHANMDEQARQTDSDSTTTCNKTCSFQDDMAAADDQHLIFIITFYTEEGFTGQIKQRQREMGRIPSHILSNQTVKVMHKGQLLAFCQVTVKLTMSPLISVSLAPPPLKQNTNVESPFQSPLLFIDLHLVAK